MTLYRLAIPDDRFWRWPLLLGVLHLDRHLTLHVPSTATQSGRPLGYV